MKEISNPLVSVLVPVYGVERHICKCVVSLFEQTYQNCEYIFVDDCTPDRSVELIKETLTQYPSRINQVKIIKHPNNCGLATARNTAIKVSSGEFIMHVDSDDFIELTTIEECVNKAMSTDSDVVIFGMKHVWNKGHSRHDSIGNIPVETHEYVKKLMRRECSVCVCGGLYRRSLYVSNNIEAIDGLNFGEDYATKPRFVYFANRIASIDKPLYNYVHYNDNSYTQSFKPSTITNLEKAIEVLWDFFKDKGEEWQNELQLTALKTKIEMLLAWGLHNGDKSSWNKIKNLYPNLEYNEISIVYRIILILSKYDMPNLARFYIKISIRLKAMLKRIK